MRPSLKNQPATLNFYTAHRRMLVDYAMQITGDRALAEDIVQDAWLALAAQGGDVIVLDPRAYLRRTIRNLAINALRRKVRERKIGGEELDASALEVAQDAPSPEADVIARTELACVMGVLATLPERQRVAIEMYRFGGHKLREIAEHLGVSIPLVHLLVSEGLAICSERCGLERLSAKNR
jgi:RNA polymerase sigma factor (sigma-70 family)